MFQADVGDSRVICLFVRVQTCEFEKAAPNLPRGLVWSVLSWPEKFAFRVGAFAFPRAGEDAVAAWIADFGETLDLQKEATEVDPLHGTVLEFIANEVLHQLAVVFTKELGESGCREVDPSTNAARELPNGWKPACLKMGQGDTGVGEN